MPIYEYECQACGQRFDRLFLSLSRVPAEIGCPACCSADVRRLVSTPAGPATGAGSAEADVAEAPPARPPVFGRKELNQALRQKTELREQAKYAKE